MTLLARIIVAALICFAIRAQSAELKIANDGTAVVDGKRTFILGLYENPKDDAVLDEVAAAGFNLVQAEDKKSALDRLAAHKLYGWVNTGARIETPPDDRDAPLVLKQLVDFLKDHPAMLVWEVPDEALWNTWYMAQLWRHNEEPKLLQEKIKALTDAEQAKKLQADLDRARALNSEGYYAEAEGLADGIWTALGEANPKPNYGLGNAQERAEKLLSSMMLGYQHIHMFDKAHPVWMNHAPRNSIDQLTSFNMAADIVGCDIYPIPEGPLVGHSDLENKSITSVGDYTKRMQEAAPGKPVWMVLQGFGWKDIQPEREEEIRRPTKAETRFMAWDAILNGAKGILYWGTAYIEKDSQLWKNLLEVVRELADSQEILCAPNVFDIGSSLSYAPAYGSRDGEVLLVIKNVNGKHVMLAVNESNTPLTFSMSNMQSIEGTSFKVRHYVNAQPQVKDGKITVTMPAHAVYIMEPQ